MIISSRRRHSVRVLSVVLLLFTQLTYASPETFRRKMHRAFTGEAAVLQNFTDDRFLSATILRHKSEHWEYVVYDETGSNVSQDLDFKVNIEVEKNHVTDQIRLRGARPEKAYYLEIRDRYDRIVDTRAMRTLPSVKESPRIAVASCSRVGLLTNEYFGKSNWERMTELKPDILLFLGDIVYADGAIQAIRGQIPTFERIQSRYVASWKRDKIYHLFDTIPTKAIWDDHEYGYNDAGIENPYRDQMLDYYRRFYPLPDRPSVSKGPGVSYAFRVMGHRFLMLDDRFFADKGTNWGVEQNRWLAENLNGEPTFVANGYAWQKYLDGKQWGAVEDKSPSELAAFANVVRKTKTKVVLLAGDSHFSEVRNADIFGYRTYEVTSSHMHSFNPRLTPPFTSGKAPGQRDQRLHTDRSNFVIVEPSDRELSSLHVSVYERGRAPRYRTFDIGMPTAARRCESLFGP